MPKYRQVVQPDGTSKLVEVVHSAPRPRLHIKNERRGFVSPVDGTWVDGQKAEREHAARNNVVHASEFGNDFCRGWFERKQKERNDFSEGKLPAHRKDVKKDLLAAYEKLANQPEN